MLDAPTLARIQGLKLRVRSLMEGVLSGLHKSPHQGQSVEFAEHKEYAPGDELRHLDWKAYGKFDRYYVKRFEQETNLRALLTVDGSASMGYRSQSLSKLEVASTLAGTLASLLVRQQDATGLCVMAKGTLRNLPPRASAGHLSLMLEELERTEAAGSTDLYSLAEHLAQALPRRSLVVLFSDLLDDREDALARILSLRQRKHDVAVFHLLDPAELTFPFDDPTVFLDMEGEQRVEVNAREIKESYLEEFHAFLAKVKQRCAEAKVDYVQVRTDERLDEVLVRFLSQRARRR